jgi:alkylation response protein AidB-like acyl-CoA dehydrogenase
MNFNLSDEQRAFADSAQALFADHCGDEQLRAFDASGEPFMRDLWRQCVANGLHSMLIAEADGGLGLGMTDLMAVLEQQGRALALVPLWEHQVAVAAVSRFGAASLRERLIAPALAGEALLSISLAALAAARGGALKATRSGDGWQLDGTAAAVPLAAQSACALLVVDVEGTPRVAAVDPFQTGVTHVSGVTQHHLAVADLHFDRVPLGAGALLDAAALRWLEPRVVACLASLQLGVTAQQLVRTVQYVSERKQFARVIGSFQLVAGQMADGHIAVEALRTSLWQLSYRLDAGQGALPQAWATRVLACDTGHRAGHMAQHVHGGMGVDVTFHIHRFLYWSRALGTAFGGAERSLAQLGDWLAEHDDLGWKYDLPEDAHADPSV